MMKLHRTYPVWLHSLHLFYHGGMVVSQLIGFFSSFHTSDDGNRTSEISGPGWRFRYVTTWILAILASYMIAALLFDLILLLKGVNDGIVQQLKIHLDRYFCVMFCTCVGMGFFFHLLFFINCHNNNSCPRYTDSLWFIHLMPFWYGFIEYLFVPHNSKRDFKTTPFLVFILCLIYMINYWLFVAQTHGHHPYGDPWPIWQWFIYFCFPLAIFVLRLLDKLRDRLHYKRGLRSPCIHPPRLFSDNPWIGWHADYSQINQYEMQPINWKAMIIMSTTLLAVVAIWNISYLITSS